MTIITFHEAAAFLDLAQPFLEAQESTNNLILGVALRLKALPSWSDQPPYLAVAKDAAGSVLLAAVITPPHNLLLASREDANLAELEPALQGLAENLLRGGWPVPGINAAYDLSRTFARVWSQAAGKKQSIEFEERIYELRQVIAPPRPPVGHLRQASRQDAAQVVAWNLAFTLETFGEADGQAAEKSALRRLENGDIYFWDDNGPVSMAARTRPTRRGESVGSVYTPPERRGHGYASACVAALSQRILDSGKQFCNLFTDLANPTSNAIYQNIGYRPVCDFTVISFYD